MMNSRRSSERIKPVAVGTGLIALDLVISANMSSPIQSWVGGTCGNVLTILSYLGWESFPVARLNNNSASQRVKEDLSQWGVRLDFAETSPTTSTPIIVQEIIENKEGHYSHKFSWSCPRCGAALPTYQPVTDDSAKLVSESITDAMVFFFDRVSPAAIALAHKCKNLGAVIVFEPSVEGNKEEFTAAINLADIVKYSGERFNSLCNLENIHPYLLEIKTLGADGLLFKWNSAGHSEGWRNLQPIKVQKVNDSCGCGDWTTAGLISKVCREGIGGFKAKSTNDIVQGLQYGQLLAAWNCQFEGARGGMYRVHPANFGIEIERFFNSSRAYSGCSVEPIRSIDRKMCPACENAKVS